MKIRRFLVALAAPLGLFLALLLILGRQTIPVRAAARPAPDPGSLRGDVQTGTDKETPDALSAPGDVITVCLVSGVCDYDTIQAAVDHATGGELIKVAAGTYTDVHQLAGLTQVVYISKSVAIRGGYTTSNWDTPDPEANPTILDAQGLGRVLVIDPPGQDFPPPEFDASPGELPPNAGRVGATAQTPAPVIEGLHLTGGDAAAGGSCYFGGFSGGGVCSLDAAAELNGNWIYGNTAGLVGVGGGVYLGTKSFPEVSPVSTLRGNRVYGNSAGDGSGLVLEWSAATLINNVIIDNVAISAEPYYQGSGVVIAGSTCRLWHTTVARNTAVEGGTGISVLSFEFGASTWMTNTIVADHASAGVSIDEWSSGSLNGVLWYGNGVDVEGPPGSITVNNEHTGTPAFAADGYHLTGSSQAIDRGVGTWLSQDIDGQTRPQGLAADLGADEYPVGTIVILKQTDPAGGAGFGFTHNITEPYSLGLDHAQKETFSNVAAGTYTVTEDDPTPAFDLTDLACVEDGTSNSTVALGNRQATIRLDSDETVTCTFTNTKRGSITVAKETDPPGGTGFAFTGDLGPFTLDHGQQQTFSNISAGTYSVTESSAAAFDLTALTCVEDVTQNSGTDLGNQRATINLDPDEIVTCTFTNTKRGSIIIAKETDPPGGTGFSFIFGADVGPPQPLTLDHGEQRTFSNISPGTYYVTENPTTTFDLTALVCVEDVTQNSDTDLGSRQATINLDPDETVTCIFTNTVSAPPTGGSTDSGGLDKDTYAPEETVYVTGTGFLPNTTVHLYIVPDHTWTNGLTIPADVSHDGMNPLLADSSGDLGPAPVWPPQLTPGEYDLVFDANQNGRYDAATDAVDDPNHPGFVVDDISVVIDPDLGGTIVYTDPQGLITSIIIPPGAVIKPVSLCFHPLLAPTYAFPTQIQYASHAFLLGDCDLPGPDVVIGGVTFPFTLPGRAMSGNAPRLYPYLPLILRDDSGGRSILDSTRNGRPSPRGKALAAPLLGAVALDTRAGALGSITFDVPILMSIGYSDSDVPSGTDEDQLLLFYWTGSQWADAASTCSPASTYVRDTINNVLQVEVCHLSEFAVGG